MSAFFDHDVGLFRALSCAGDARAMSRDGQPHVERGEMSIRLSGPREARCLAFELVRVAAALEGVARPDLADIVKRRDEQDAEYKILVSRSSKDGV